MPPSAVYSYGPKQLLKVLSGLAMWCAGDRFDKLMYDRLSLSPPAISRSPSSLPNQCRFRHSFHNRPLKVDPAVSNACGDSSSGQTQPPKAWTP